MKLAALAAPPSDYNHEQKGDALYAMELALALEKLNFKMLFELHETAEKRKDANMTDFVEEMLSEQVGFLLCCGLTCRADHLADCSHPQTQRSAELIVCCCCWEGFELYQQRALCCEGHCLTLHYQPCLFLIR